MLIVVLGWLLLGNRKWYTKPGIRGYFVMLLGGAVVAVAVEKIALALGRWTYAPQMPVLPIVEVGLAPLLQLLLLPPITLWNF